MIQEPRKPDAIPRLETYRAGEGLSAAKLNRGVDAVNRLVRGLRPARQIRPTPRPRPRAITETVVLTVEPVDTDMSLTVRKVKYATSPPVTGEPPELAGYDWDGDEFVAFPDFGSVALDYADSFSVIETVPGVNDTFLQVFRHQGNPIVELPDVDGPQQFRFKEHGVLSDFFGAVSWDGNDEGPTILIMKPYELRVTPFHVQIVDGHLYEYASNTQRKVTSIASGESEHQVIIPSYRIDGLIYATRPIGGGVTGLAGDLPDDPIWLDDNRDGRAWARMFRQP